MTSKRPPFLPYLTIAIWFVAFVAWSPHPVEEGVTVFHQPAAVSCPTARAHDIRWVM